MRRVAARGVVILERPSRKQDVAPPMAHRVSPDQLQGLVAELGLPAARPVELTHVVLYIVDR